MSVARCQCCKNIFPYNRETCPSCGKRGSKGRRNFLLKMVAILVFLIALSLSFYEIIH